MWIAWLYLIFGMGVLYFGAESLVRGAGGIAQNFNIRPALIGLTLVAFGTSVPELTVTAIASAKGEGAISLGNIVGSNIANIGLVVGIAALIRPLRVERMLIKREVPISVFAIVIFYLMSIDGTLGRVDGAILVLCMVVFSIYIVRKGIKEKGEREAGGLPSRHGLGVCIVLVFLGIVGVVAGGHVFLKSAVSIARHFGINEFFIGITMVALGTSLPELATSSIAAFRKQDDMCVANVVGSNIINIFCGIGIASLIAPISVDPSLLKNEFLFLLGFGMALLPLLKTGLGISRLEGAMCLLAYAAFIYFSYIT